MALFTGANSYTGSTSLQSGMLDAGNPEAFGTGNFTNSGGTLEMANDNHTLFNGGNFVQTSGTTLLSIVNSTTAESITTTGDGRLNGNLTANLNALSRPARGRVRLHSP